MDIVILNYPTGEVDVIRGIDDDFLNQFFADDIELYLEDRGYNIHDIHYMCTEKLVINDLNLDEL